MDVLRQDSFKDQGFEVIVTLTQWPLDNACSVSISEFDPLTKKVIRFARETFDNPELATLHYERLIS